MMRTFSVCGLFLLLMIGVASAGYEAMVMARETSQNANTAAPAKTPTPQRRGRRRRPAAEPARTPDMSMPAEAATTPETSMPASPVNEAGEPTDLSGTYSGTMDCADAGLSGPTTLTITGNNFTTSDGKSGRLVANTTHGYTAVAMQFGDLPAAVPGQPSGPPPTIVSMRARKSGDHLTLMAIPTSGHTCSFTSAGTTRMRRHRRPATAATPATSAEPAMPAVDTGTAAPAQPATSATPATPRRRGRRGTRNMNANTNMGNTNTGSNMNDNTGTGGEGNTNAKPTPTPPIRPN